MGEEIYAAIVATSGYITSGIWDIRFTAANVLDGFFNMWLPPVSTLSSATGFLRPSPEYIYNTGDFEAGNMCWRQWACSGECGHIFRQGS